MPKRRAFVVKSKKRWRSVGICWFKDDAREIAHAFTLAWRIRECGVPVTKVATHRPGQILYRDDFQIVAKPEAATPTVALGASPWLREPRRGWGGESGAVSPVCGL